MKYFIGLIALLVSIATVAQTKVQVNSYPEDAFVVHKTPDGNRGQFTPGKMKIDFGQPNELTFVKAGYCPCIQIFDGGGAVENVECKLTRIEFTADVKKVHKIGIGNPIFELRPNQVIYDGGSYADINFSHSWAYGENLYYDFKSEVRNVLKKHGVEYETLVEDNLMDNIRDDVRFYLTPIIIDIWYSQKGAKRGCKLNVEWRVYDKVTKETTSYFSVGGGVSDYYENQNILDAMHNATGCVMNNPDFLKFLSTEVEKPVTRTPAAPATVNETAVNVPAVTLPTLESKADIMKYALSSFVTIRTEKGHGSGTIISDDGYIITAASLVGNARIIEVRTRGGDSEVAKMVNSNADYDIALLKVADPKGMNGISLDNDDLLMTAEEIMVIGSNDDIDLGAKADQGLIMSKQKQNGKIYLEVDFKPNTASNGGALINSKGQFAGIINTNVGNGQLALPVKKALEILNVTVE